LSTSFTKLCPIGSSPTVGSSKIMILILRKLFSYHIEIDIRLDSIKIIYLVQYMELKTQRVLNLHTIVPFCLIVLNFFLFGNKNMDNE
jgi:hypothetical protein